MKTAVLAAATAACALAAGAAPVAAQTCPHPGTVNGQSVLIYCGTAKATMTAGSLAVAWKNGLCKKAAGNFYLSFGAVVTQPTKHAPDSFLVIAGTGGATVMLTKSGKSYLGDSLKLTMHGTRAGTVAGVIEPTLTNGKLAFHATFTC